MANGCRDVAIILRHPKFKKSKSTNTFHYERKKILEPMFDLESRRKELQLNKAKQMVDQIYPTELQLNKANSSDTEAPFWT